MTHFPASLRDRAKPMLPGAGEGAFPLTGNFVTKKVIFPLKTKSSHMYEAGAMAHITAEYLIRHLERAGFALMRSEPAAAPTTAHMPSSRD